MWSTYTKTLLASQDDWEKYLGLLMRNSPKNTLYFGEPVTYPCFVFSSSDFNWAGIYEIHSVFVDRWDAIKLLSTLLGGRPEEDERAI